MSKPVSVGEAMPDLKKILAERQRQDAEIAGTCERHGEYTRGEAHRTDGQCPQCFAEMREKQERAYRLDEFKRVSGVPRRFQTCTLDSFTPPTPAARTAAETVRHYAEDFPAHMDAGRCVIMAGKTGTGKTHLACATIRHIMLEHRMPGLYTTAYHIVRDIKDTYGRDADSTERAVVRGFVEPALLVVDEVGVQYGTDAEKLLLFEVLNGRYEAMKPTIVVSNLEPAGIGDYLGDRVMDRLRENAGALLVFDWQSKRGAA